MIKHLLAPCERTGTFFSLLAFHNPNSDTQVSAATPQQAGRVRRYGYGCVQGHLTGKSARDRNKIRYTGRTLVFVDKY